MLNQAVKVVDLKLPWSGYIGCKTRPLTELESLFLIQLWGTETNSLDSLIEDSKQRSAPFAIMERRLSVYKLLDKVDPRVVILCGANSLSPRDAVIWAFTLNYIWVASRKVVDLSEWVKWFPYGFPTDEEKKRIWYEQKLSKIPNHGIEDPMSDNWVDHYEVWPK